MIYGTKNMISPLKTRFKKKKHTDSLEDTYNIKQRSKIMLQDTRKNMTIFVKNCQGEKDQKQTKTFSYVISIL